MNRNQLSHVIRASADIAEQTPILVVGSQAILASYDSSSLPESATRSIEADIAFLVPDTESTDAEELADRVDGAIGEGSRFHQQFGYYAQGVSVGTAVLPSGWRERALRFDFGDVGGADAICPEIHDLVVAKLVAGRQKDYEYALALLQAGMVDRAVLEERLAVLEVVGAVRRRIARWIRANAGDG